MNAPLTATQLLAQTNLPSLENEYASEVRFGLVLYGGVSLSIYINGVVQEMFEMVRSTPKKSQQDKSLEGMGEIYYRLAWLAQNPDIQRSYAEQIRKRKDENKNPLEDVWNKVARGNSLPARLVIDVISGTSAGGINGIFLAKALTNGSDFSRLRQLWIEEGDIKKLLNDKLSYQDIKSSNIAGRHIVRSRIKEAGSAPKSLLNSKRMYYKLASAMDDVSPDSKRNRDGKTKAKVKIEPMVDELDLFVTTTDIAGSPVPLRLSGRLVEERRHKQCFHFSYSEQYGHNDFTLRHNTLLSFAARCTSAFPFAFEPMTMNEVRELDPAGFKAVKDDWHKYLSYLPKASNEPEGQLGHAFGDGGYLDNKPFTYVTKTLATREALVPIERKLVYIEPAPEKQGKEREQSPDALENSIAALTGIPRYETIREDLQEVLSRNRSIERVERIIHEGEIDLRNMLKTKENPYIDVLKASSKGEIPPWPDFDRQTMSKLYGPAFLAYRRMRVSSTTDELAYAVAKLWKIDFKSDYLYALTALLRKWREHHYHEEPKGEQKTINTFLAQFDLVYRIRRLGFLLKQIDLTLRLLRRRLEHPYEELPDTQSEQGKKHNRRHTPEQDRYLIDHLTDEGIPLTKEAFNHEAVQHAIFALKKLKSQLIANLKRLRMEEYWRREATSRPSFIDSARLAELDSLRALMNPAWRQELEKILSMLLGENEHDVISLTTIGTRTQEFRLSENAIKACACTRSMQECVLRRTGDFFDQLKAKHEYEKGDTKTRFFDVLERTTALLSLESNHPMPPDQLIKSPKTGTYDNLGHPKLKLNPDKKGKKHVIVEIDPLEDPVVDSHEGMAMRRIFGEYYIYYDLFDQMSFPLYHGTGIGEPATVEIIRISPEDATSLINEKAEGETRRKLAGTALANFGAFLDEKWRHNDIMWGRLDGAERLIQTLLPLGDPDSKAIRTELIDRANRTILRETMLPKELDNFSRLFFSALEHVPKKGSVLERIQRLLRETYQEKTGQDKRLEAVLATFVKDKELAETELVNYVKTSRDVDRTLPPKETFASASRAVTISGRLLADLNRRYGKANNVFRWLARGGLFLQSLIAISMPGTFKAYWFRRIITTLYVIEALFMVSAILLSASNAVLLFISKVFVLTLAAHFLIIAAGNILSGDTRWLARLKTLGMTAVLSLAVWGAYDLSQQYMPSYPAAKSAYSAAQSLQSSAKNAWSELTSFWHACTVRWAANRNPSQSG